MSRWLTILRLRIQSLVRRSAAEHDLDDELQFHVEQAIQQRMDQGLSPEEARRLALAAMGGVESRKEEIRQARRVAWTLDVLVQDLRYGLRTLIKARGLTATAILSLALGVGANAIVFSVVHATLLTPLPYTDADRLVRIWTVEASRPAVKVAATAPEYWAWKMQSTLVDAVGTEYQGTSDLAGEGAEAAPERVEVQGFTPSLFEVLNVRPQLGRAFREDEAAIDHEAPVVIISDGLWQRRFHREPGVLGQTVRLDGEPRAIVGVMPKGFSFDDDRAVDVWRPYALNARQLRGSVHGFRVTARLKPGVGVRQLQSELDRIALAMTREFPAREQGWSPRVEDLHEALYGNLRQPLMLLQGIVGVVLLIACANVAGLLLARGSTRTTEIAVRSAIGAGRGRIVRQLLTESVLLALVGGAAGMGVAGLGLRTLVSSLAESFPPITSATLDGDVVLFAIALSVLTGL
jgi:predicted permease